MAIAVFNYAAWSIRYPTLAAAVDETLATMYFSEAELYLDNTDGSIVTDVAQRLTLLNMLVAHIAGVNGATAASAAGLVGRVSSVTEGSVTIATDFQAPGSAGWYAQTSWGAQYWAASARYRTMQYITPDPPFLGVPGYGGRRWPN